MTATVIDCSTLEQRLALRKRTMQLPRIMHDRGLGAAVVIKSVGADTDKNTLIYEIVMPHKKTWYAEWSEFGCEADFSPKIVPFRRA